jgi:polyisoprenoid-binding protein YceI
MNMPQRNRHALAATRHACDSSEFSRRAAFAVRASVLFAALALPGVSPLFAAPQQFTIAKDGKSYAGFTIDDTIEKVDGSTPKVSGAITLDPDHLSESSVAMSVDLASLDTGNGLRDSDMRDTLDVSKFPAAVFKSTVINGPAAIAMKQPVDVRIGGDFTLHGVTHRISVPVHLLLTSPNRLQATAKFTIRMTDYDITVPDKLIVSVANEVLVRFELAATARP